MCWLRWASPLALLLGEDAVELALEEADDGGELAGDDAEVCDELEVCMLGLCSELEPSSEPFTGTVEAMISARSS